MADSAGCAQYFQNKAASWILTDGSVEDHVRRLGREGLADEFRADGGFGEVCQFVRELGELQLRSHILNSLEGQVGDAFGAPIGGELNIIIGAAALACGFTTIGQKLVIVGLAAVAITGIIAALSSRRR